jgi:hypothetical protein
MGCCDSSIPDDVASVVLLPIIVVVIVVAAAVCASTAINGVAATAVRANMSIIAIVFVDVLIINF